MTLFNYNQIDEYQIEITTYCNAACPQCPRNINGGIINPHLKLEHLARDIIDRAFSSELCQRLRQVFFCGSYGDPIMHPNFLDILQDFRLKCPTLWLYMHTNGGAHDQEYWIKIARILQGYGQVDFNIDGLADTNYLYRKNTSFNKIISNASAFINAGGRAKWNFIVFEHNQHQVDEARKMSQDLGFKEFSYRSTGRFLNHKTMTTFDQWPVVDKNGHKIYTIKPTTDSQFTNQSIDFLPTLHKQYSDIDDYFRTVDIKCDSLTHNRVAINAHGTVLPCNMLNHNLTDARFYDSDVMPCSNKLSTVDGKNQVAEFIKLHNESSLNIKHNSIEQIFNSTFWAGLEDSWKSNSFPNRIFECALTCGKKFTKVWDQTKMKKKFLISGGNRGLGLALVNHSGGQSISRSNGYNITNAEDINRIVEESLDYDVFINNAFDGPPHEDWANFAQTNLYMAVYNAWKNANKSGWIINIGSIGCKNIVAPDPSFETYRISKAALEHASKQGTQAFKQNKVPFKTTLITLDRLDTELSRSRANWTGNGVDLSDICNFIDYGLTLQSNTCIEEVTLYCNLEFSLTT
jgi:MoaA/NifB/PqqE/SkfB family radical SAM enzyme